MGNTNKAWEKWGQSNPYFGVLSSDEFRKEKFSEEARLNFFRSGEGYVDQVLKTIHSHFDPGFRASRSLDFGCGVGRLLIPLAKCSDDAVGIDVSPSMLAETQKNCDAFGVGNVRLVQSDDRLSGLVGKFDLINSCIVFQHIPARRGEKLCSLLSDRLQPGGVVALNFDYHCFSSVIVRGVVKARYALPLANWVRNLLRGFPLANHRWNAMFMIWEKSWCCLPNMALIVSSCAAPGRVNSWGRLFSAGSDCDGG